MNTKTKYFALRIAVIFMITVLSLAAMRVGNVSAAPVTYNFQVDAGNPVATGVITDDEVCNKNKLTATITLMSTAAQNCTFHIIKPTTAGTQNIVDVWFNTPYAVVTTVTGTSLKIHLREKTGGGGGPETWTAGFMLMYVNADGTITNFNGPEATRLVGNSTDVDHTIDLSAQSASVPAGSKLGIRVRAVSSTSANMEVYYGSAADVAGTGTSGILIVQEVEKLSQTINVGTAAPGSAVYGSSFTVAATATSGLTVVYSASGSCSVVGATFTMTSGTGTCIVQYNQAGNGIYNAAPQVTNNVSATTRPITITADAKSKLVGAPDPALTYQITNGTLVAPDVFTGVLTRVAGETAGQYDIQQGSVALNGNYTLTYVGAKLTIFTPLTKTIPSTGAQDGWVLESGENTNAGGTMNASATTVSIGDNNLKKQYRSIFSFKTAPLPDNAVITKVTLKLKRGSVLPAGTNPIVMLQGIVVDVRKGFFGSASGLQLADFNATANKTVGPFSPALSAGWYTINLNNTTIPLINKLTTNSGLTQFRLRFKLDDNNNAIANVLNLVSGDNATAANKPALIIEYHMP